MKGVIMGIISDFRYRKISQTATIEDLLKEFFRKTIHLCAALVPFFAWRDLPATVMVLSFMAVFYSISEYLRLTGFPLPVISRITAYASRRRDEGRFVLGPITMVMGILAALLLLPARAATVGIFALAFGDGIASLAGKLFGRTRIPYTRGKTLEGSFACFIAVYVSSIVVLKNPLHAGIVALIAMCIEMLPVRDYDNVLIPVAIGAVVCLLP